MRVENVKGAVWTVDEIEFYKRRPQRCSAAAVAAAAASTSSSSVATASASIATGLAPSASALSVCSGVLTSHLQQHHQQQQHSSHHHQQQLDNSPLTEGAHSQAAAAAATAAMAMAAMAAAAAAAAVSSSPQTPATDSTTSPATIAATSTAPTAVLEVSSHLQSMMLGCAAASAGGCRGDPAASSGAASSRLPAAGGHSVGYVRLATQLQYSLDTLLNTEPHTIGADARPSDEDVASNRSHRHIEQSICTASSSDVVSVGFWYSLQVYLLFVLSIYPLSSVGNNFSHSYIRLKQKFLRIFVFQIFIQFRTII